MSNYIDNRLADGRTISTGKHNVKDYTHRENRWASILCEHYNECGFKCKVTACSLGRDGEFINGSVNSDPDFVFISLDPKFPDKTKEIKTNPNTNKWHHRFKNDNNQISHYLEVGADIIVPMVESSVWDEKNKKWLSGYYNYPNKILPWLLQHPDIKDPNYFGGKLHKRVRIEDIDEKIRQGEIKFYEWSPKAKALVDEWAWELTRPKKTD